MMAIKVNIKHMMDRLCQSVFEEQNVKTALEALTSHNTPYEMTDFDYANVEYVMYYIKYLHKEAEIVISL